MHLPVTLALRPSRYLAAGLIVAHGAAGVALVPIAWHPAIRVALWVVLGLSLVRTLRPHGVSAVKLNADGELDLIGVDGQVRRGRVQAATTVLPWLGVVLVRGGWGTCALVLPPDALPPGQHRQLRLWLKWQAKAVAG